MTVFIRTTLVVSVMAFTGSLHAQAPQPIPAQQQMVPQQQAMPQQMRPQQRYPQQFMPRNFPQANNVWNSAPAYQQNYFNRSPWSNSMQMPWNNSGANGNNFSMPWNNNSGNNGNGFNMPWNSGSNGNGFSMPWNNGSNGNGFNMPWNNNSRSNYPPSQGRNNSSNSGMPMGNFNGPWNNGSNAFPQVKGPWNNGWGAAPWSSERWQNDPMGSPSKWINFNDPKEGVAEMWEDAIKGPHRLGKMPGGWKAPSISVPNPVDVTDTFGRRWRGLPSEISEQADNFTYNVAK